MCTLYNRCCLQSQVTMASFTTCLAVVLLASLTICTSSSPAFYPKAAAEDALPLWKSRLQAVKTSVPNYESERYSGRGIVTSAGGRAYFTSAVLMLNQLRSTGCTLPVELFYAGDDELNAVAVEYLETEYDVQCIDLSKQPEMQGLNLKGYQIKALALYYSSFEEVIWMDADNFALHDPEELFDSEMYKKHGAVMWPDVCNMVSVRKETYKVFGRTAPEPFLQPRDGKRTIWNYQCSHGQPNEVETGQLVLDKKRAWKGLYMMFWINYHHGFFLQRLFHGDKMTFPFAFELVNVDYSVVPYMPASIGVGDVKAKTFCGNTLAQKHPDHDDILFLHRSLAKFKDPSSYFAEPGHDASVWTHVYQQPARGSYPLVMRGELPNKHFATADNGIHMECLSPLKLDASSMVDSTKELQDVEERALDKLREVRRLPFYPGYRKCTPENMFFCKHP
eukprot:m.42686 g.42686  ORF g.42686 m.42686 type:complete len:449 (+) comp12907_c0_seq1:82-1428(+)